MSDTYAQPDDLDSLGDAIGWAVSQSVYDATARDTLTIVDADGRTFTLAGCCLADALSYSGNATDGPDAVRVTTA
jgi:hypothetical protein